LIVVDTSVLVGLVDERDALHDRSFDDLRKLTGKQLWVLDSVLTETCFLLRRRQARARLRLVLAFLRVRQSPLDTASWNDVFDWMERYADHEPDLADAQLVIMSARDRTCRIWTYDREFVHLWRRPDGSKIPLVTR
jgi:predicted nucleic acid-binding protein